MRATLHILILAFLLLSTLNPVRAELLLNEALSDPDSDWNSDGEISFRDDEWIEIYNSGPGSESLAGVYLRDGTGDSFHFGFSGSLLPGEVRVVYGAEAVAWQAANGAGSSGLSLNNGGDRIELLRDSGDPLVPEILDAVDIPAHAAASQRALGRAPDGGAWILYDSLSPYGGSADPPATGCAPSPGMANLCGGIVPTLPSSMARLKAQFGSDR